MLCFGCLFLLVGRLTPGVPLSSRGRCHGRGVWGVDGFGWLSSVTVIDGFSRVFLGFLGFFYGFSDVFYGSKPKVPCWG